MRRWSIIKKYIKERKRMRYPQREIRRRCGCAWDFQPCARRNGLFARLPRWNFVYGRAGIRVSSIKTDKWEGSPAHCCYRRLNCRDCRRNTGWRKTQDSLQSRIRDKYFGKVLGDRYRQCLDRRMYRMRRTRRLWTAWIERCCRKQKSGCAVQEKELRRIRTKPSCFQTIRRYLYGICVDV